MDHLKNAEALLSEWRSRSEHDNQCMCYVYDAENRLLFSGGGSGTEWGGLVGVAEQVAREASLFDQSATYFALVTELCVAGTDQKMQIWCGSRRGGDSVSASIPIVDEFYANPHLAEIVGNAFWQAYTQTESEYTQS